MIVRIAGTVVLLVGLAVGVGCRADRTRPPIERSAMTDLLVALHIEQARASVSGTDDGGWADSVLSEFGVSRGEYESAMIHYAERPRELVSIMDSVIDLMRVRRPSADVDGQNPLYARPYGSVFRDTLADLKR